MSTGWVDELGRRTLLESKTMQKTILPDQAMDFGAVDARTELAARADRRAGSMNLFGVENNAENNSMH